MNTIVKLLAVVAVLLALIVGAWCLLFPSSGQLGPSEAERSSSAVFEQNRRVIESLCTEFGQGWSPNRYAEGQALIANSPGLSTSERDALRDAMANGIVENLDNYISGVFANAYPRSHSSAVPGLNRAYDGLDTLGRDFPNILHSERYASMQSDRQAIDAVHAFGQQTMVAPPQVSLSLIREGNSVRLNWNLALCDYDNYAREKHSRRQQLLSDLRTRRRLARVTWTNSVLSEGGVNEKITQGKSIYYTREFATVSGFLDELPRHPLLQTDAAAREKIRTQDLPALRNSLGTFISPQRTRTLQTSIARAARELQNQTPEQTTPLSPL